MSNKAKGMICIIIATMCYGFVPILIRMTYDEGSDPTTTSFLRFFLAIPIVLIPILKKRVSLKITGKEVLYLAISGAICMAGATLLISFSYNYISVGMSATLHFIYPIFVAMVCVALFKEKFDKWKLIALLASTCGVVAFMEKGQTTGSWLGITLALLSGIAYGVYMIIVDKTSLNKMYVFMFTFYISIFTAIATLAFSPLTGGLSLATITPKGWLICAAYSILSTVVAVTLFQAGIVYVGAATAAIVSTVEPITSVLMGILLLGETITIFKIVGCALIILSIVFISRSAKPNDVIQMETNANFLQ